MNPDEIGLLLRYARSVADNPDNPGEVLPISAALRDWLGEASGPVSRARRLVALADAHGAVCPPGGRPTTLGDPELLLGPARARLAELVEVAA